MNRRILLDTGPLVAFLNRNDHYHDWAKAEWGQIAPPLLTCESVLSEACFLLRSASGGSEAVMELLGRGVIAVPFQLQEHAEPVSRLLRKYADVPMALSDACLVRMAETIAGSRVMTLDSDFRLYRKSGRQVVPTIMPG